MTDLKEIDNSTITKGKGTLPNSFFNASTTLTPKPDKEFIRKKTAENYIPYKYRCKIPEQDSGKPNPEAYKKDYTS